MQAPQALASPWSGAPGLSSVQCTCHQLQSEEAGVLREQTQALKGHAAPPGPPTSPSSAPVHPPPSHSSSHAPCPEHPSFPTAFTAVMAQTPFSLHPCLYLSCSHRLTSRALQVLSRLQACCKVCPCPSSSGRPTLTPLGQGQGAVSKHLKEMSLTYDPGAHQMPAPPGCAHRGAGQAGAQVGPGSPGCALCSHGLTSKTAHRAGDSAAVHEAGRLRFEAGHRDP